MHSNIILEISEITDNANIKIFIMNKNEFSYPKQTYDVSKDSSQKNFNISGSYFEYILYIMPDTYSSGSYRVNAYLEEGYQPKAFDDNKPIEVIDDQVEDVTVEDQIEEEEEIEEDE